MSFRGTLLTTALGATLVMASGTATAGDRAGDEEQDEIQASPPVAATTPATTPATPVTLPQLPAHGSGIVTGDTIYLHNGGLIRGTVQEIVPGVQVTILGATGQVAATVRWGEIDRVELGNGPRVAPPPPTPVSVPVPVLGTRPAKKGPMARLHIESKRSVQLYRQAAQESGWYEACSSPCDEDMPLNDEYRISGAGIFQSRDFTLEGTPGSRVVITVNPGTRSAFLVGGALTAAGGLVDYFGLAITAVAASSHHGYCPTSSGSSYYSADSSYGYSSCSSGNRDNGAVAVGVGMLIVGTALMGTGVVLMIANGSTGVNQNESSTSAAKLPLDAYKREAIWSPPTTAVPTAAPLLSFPVLSRSF